MKTVRLEIGHIVTLEPGAPVYLPGAQFDVFNRKRRESEPWRVISSWCALPSRRVILNVTQVRAKRT